MQEQLPSEIRGPNLKQVPRISLRSIRATALRGWLVKNVWLPAVVQAAAAQVGRQCLAYPDRGVELQ